MAEWSHGSKGMGGGGVLSVVKVNANVQEDRSFPGMYAVRSLAMKYSRVAWTHMSAAASCMCVLSCRKFLLANLCTSTLRLHSKAVEYSLPYTPPMPGSRKGAVGSREGGGLRASLRYLQTATIMTFRKKEKF